jgi:hypothetical protein
MRVYSVCLCLFMCTMQCFSCVVQCVLVCVCVCVFVCVFMCTALDWIHVRKELAEKLTAHRLGPRSRTSKTNSGASPAILRLTQFDFKYMIGGKTWRPLRVILWDAARWCNKTWRPLRVIPVHLCVCVYLSTYVCVCCCCVCVLFFCMSERVCACALHLCVACRYMRVILLSEFQSFFAICNTYSMM